MKLLPEISDTNFLAIQADYSKLKEDLRMMDFYTINELIQIQAAKFVLVYKHGLRDDLDNHLTRVCLKRQDLKAAFILKHNKNLRAWTRMKLRYPVPYPVAVYH